MRVEIPSEHTALKECWMTDQEVTIDETMAKFFGGRYAPGCSGTAHAFDIDVSCDFDGVPMTRVAEFAVRNDGVNFSGRVFLMGESGGVALTGETRMIERRTGACAAPNIAFRCAALAFRVPRRDLTG